MGNDQDRPGLSSIEDGFYLAWWLCLFIRAKATVRGTLPGQVLRLCWQGQLGKGGVKGWCREGTHSPANSSVRPLAPLSAATGSRHEKFTLVMSTVHSLEAQNSWPLSMGVLRFLFQGGARGQRKVRTVRWRKGRGRERTIKVKEEGERESNRRVSLLLSGEERKGDRERAREPSLT